MVSEFGECGMCFQFEMKNREYVRWALAVGWLWIFCGIPQIAACCEFNTRRSRLHRDVPPGTLELPFTDSPRSKSKRLESAMKPHLLTLMVSVVGIFHGCAQEAPEDETGMPASATQIRVVTNEGIEFAGDSYSSGQIDSLLNAFDRQFLDQKSSPDFRATLRVAPEVRTGLVEQIARTLAERGYERVVLELIDDTDAQSRVFESWVEPLMRLKIEIGPEGESEYLIRIRLTADADSAFQQVYFGANPLGADIPQCFDRLNNQVAALVGAGGDMMDDVVVELDAPENLQFRYAFAALVACAGRRDADGRWFDYNQTIRFYSESDSDVIFNEIDVEALSEP